jgi:hypothetical protein
MVDNIQQQMVPSECPSHPGEKAKLFCLTDCSLICTDCIFERGLKTEELKPVL